LVTFDAFLLFVVVGGLLSTTSLGDLVAIFLPPSPPLAEKFVVWAYFWKEVCDFGFLRGLKRRENVWKSLGWWLVKFWFLRFQQ
jgi:hypothetical protein